MVGCNYVNIKTLYIFIWPCFPFLDHPSKYIFKTRYWCKVHSIGHFIKTKSLYISHKEVYGSPTPISCRSRINLHLCSTKKEFKIDDILSSTHICLKSKYAQIRIKKLHLHTKIWIRLQKEFYDVICKCFHC